MKPYLALLTLLALLLAACSPAPTPEPTDLPTPEIITSTNTPAPTPEPVEDPIYLAIIWHQHQPVYFKDPDTGIYAKPWVRVHATKDYVDMAAILKEYPDIRATFNLTPSLIRQLDDLDSGAKDLYQVYAEIPAEDLNDEQKQFILDRFFDTNRKIIARFPRYQQLLDLRSNSPDPLSAYTTDDFRDLQILFNLAWVDPDWLAEEPLASLVAQGEGFSEDDKATLFAEHARLIGEVIPLHRELQDAGQIEVTMTPFAHPILPLLVNTALARNALPSIDLPGEPFVFGQDAQAQVELGVQMYTEHFGQPPAGMWPAEGSVAEEIVSMVARNGIQWMATDEGVLANSLGFDSFTRDSNEVVAEADTLYRPYYVEGQRGGPVAVVFRDIVISDKVGFTYSGLPGEAAAQDFIDRIHAIRQQLIDQGAEGPHLVSVILDGENAWEYYDNDGKEFLHSLYQLLSDDPTIITTTPSEFLDMAPDQPQIDELWAGSWISHDFSTWIGEDEENTGWEYLATTRNHLQRYISGNREGEVSDEALEAAITQMYIAEGSDWFWWFGSDQSSGDDGSFDLQFRDTLRQVYLLLGDEPPQFLDIPIIPQQAVGADVPATDLLSATVDGTATEGEWDAGGTYLASGGVMSGGEPFFASLGYGFDSQNLYIQAQLAEGASLPDGDSSIEIYVAAPGTAPPNNATTSGTILGFPANTRVGVQFSGGVLSGATLYTSAGGDVWEEVAALDEAAFGNLLELAIPLDLLGNADIGDRLTLRAVFTTALEAGGVTTTLDADQIPALGPAALTVPDLGKTTLVLDITDPTGDDNGPGTYLYPTDAVFSGGSYDVLQFQVGYDDDNIVFRFALDGPIDNVWGSPNGISIQTFDVYISQGGDGAIDMLPGRNLALAEGFSWDYAITVEGWAYGIYVPGDDGPERIAESSEFQVIADPGQRKVTIRIPKAILGDDPENWLYAAALLSQEGFPSSGVQRVRDVLPSAEQWRVGGGPAGATNHTRVIDYVWPEDGQQAAWLSDYTPTDAPQGDLTADDFARVPMLEAE